MAVHLVGLVDLGLPFVPLGLLASSVIWLLKRGESAEVDYHGREAINFQLNILFWQIAAIPLILCCLIGIPLEILLPFAKFALIAVAALRAIDGQRWPYPLIVRVLR